MDKSRPWDPKWTEQATGTPPGRKQDIGARRAELVVIDLVLTMKEWSENLFAVILVCTVDNSNNLHNVF